ncbi:hypothetical protein J2Z22_004426 [Paenibacillus forsythiae]|uniref:TetR family transcriptional regulator n=1 Tax=Paenibacillus forsythiae TaxID=365616 RepID=A0ABU3HDD5_9BACL|nr:hypothetical protein [Paenibacillus forsythiae]
MQDLLAVQWSRGKSDCTVEEMTDQVLAMITEGTSRLI